MLTGILNSSSGTADSSAGYGVHVDDHSPWERQGYYDIEGQ